MRFLFEYPITAEEIVAQLDDIQIDARREGIGSLRPMIRRAIKNYFTENPTHMAELVESLKVKSGG